MDVAKNNQWSLSSRTYNALRETLILGSFAPGERLLLDPIAHSLGTSITPVREACIRLVGEQALEFKSGRFAMVPELTHSRYMQLRLIRLELEGLAAELACGRAAQSDVDELSSTHRAFVAAERSGDFAEAKRCNRAFHFRVYRLSGMEMLVSQIESLWASMGPILSLFYGMRDNDYIGAAEHDNLITAFRRGDRSAAREAIQQDIIRGGAPILRYLNEKEAAA
ncbi:MAG: GntR family transcriptional regulator [Mesorhizobium sp.]|uniref:GntR family transcriptional regulator n=1 Tax=Mesorhizobium sp. TaxID=1871066 RepID=UPI000FE62BBD|nr:GntR family transcriptional regulator [Mesorhizobium sp.]RWI08710.1 MAG: GntR family transcriptional regulator [Mesorhizobium sp.]RWM85659.1 MAG: GntR family transcriptional regulator [Mesorhizobium sp.]TIO13928.1 MAG: GntR family transcriptional regulator [Mesorhizobium sp.]TIP90464.1 MAG: GntR family transcriptional regulator [Mesorhizobium sp.]TIP92673.1 MAG: GntR family transcriptional regulator [Mesorhizobium sp.]